jgi:UDP-3-O-[3-hydroxymyristoyl] N-acetylglucosamine deacetylase
MTTTAPSRVVIPSQSATITVKGHGLITGLPVSVTLTPALVGQGITFQLPNGAIIPASLHALADANRGVTLMDPATGKTLSIVEHFLCACALSNRMDVRVVIEMTADAPLWELPLLDGSAADWLPFLNQLPCRGEESPITLDKALWYQQNDDVCVYALPADRLQITYAIHLDHPETANQWARWNSATDDIRSIAHARTFGLLRELPALQASGLARGVNLDTLAPPPRTDFPQNVGFTGRFDADRPQPTTLTGPRYRHQRRSC